MNLFEKIFSRKDNDGTSEPNNIHLKKGDLFISFTNHLNFKVVRLLPDGLKERLNSSTLNVIQSPLYSHYLTENLIYKGQNDQNWKNQMVYFWKADEPFSRKSLPPIFDTYTHKRFVFVSNKSNFSLNHGKVIPWFGMPGLGEKYFCEISNEIISVPDLKKLGIVEYIEPVDLTFENVNILTDKDNYFFLMNERIVQFKSCGFYVHDKLVSNEVAYAIGGIDVLKKID